MTAVRPPVPLEQHVSRRRSNLLAPFSYRGFRRRDDERILSLLAIRLGNKPRGDKARAIDLEFSGGATLRLGVAAIRVHATDIGEPWPTAWQPDHDAGDPP